MANTIVSPVSPTTVRASSIRVKSLPLVPSRPPPVPPPVSSLSGPTRVATATEPYSTAPEVVVPTTGIEPYISGLEFTHQSPSFTPISGDYKSPYYAWPQIQPQPLPGTFAIKRWVVYVFGIIAILGVVGIALAIALRVRSSNSFSGPTSSITPNKSTTTPLEALTQSAPPPTTIISTLIPSSPTTTTTSSSSSITALSLPTAGLLPLDCPSLDGRTYVHTSYDTTFTFSMHCDADLAVSDSSNAAAFTIYTFAACMDACSSLNLIKNTPNGACAAVSWIGNLSYIAPAGLLGNCFLKTTADGPIAKKPQGGRRAVGLLQKTSARL